MRPMILVLAAALAAAVLTTSSAEASEKTDVIAMVKEYMGSFNKGDKNGNVAACAAQARIVDELPAYAWAGPTARAHFWNDNEACGKKNEMSGEKVAVHEPKAAELIGNPAYVVQP